MRFTRIILKNWRNFKSVDIEVELRAFFIGPNAAGKTNLLDAILFLRDLSTSAGGGLQHAVSRMRGGVSDIRSFVATRNANILIEVTLGDDKIPDQWTYLIELRAGKDGGLPVVVREVVLRHGASKPVLSRPDADDERDPPRLTETALEQISANRAFRVIAEFFASIQYLNVIPQVVREPERSTGAADVFGGGLIARINATPKPTRDARLRRMQSALQIAVPQLSDLELDTSDPTGQPHLRAKYKHWRPHGVWQRENRFSDGTLRLLALIWTLQEQGGPLLLEEPEVSLNTSIVARLAPLMARASVKSHRQVLVTTHSAALLNADVASSEVHVLQPTEQGTRIVTGSNIESIAALVENGMPMGEAIMPLVGLQDADAINAIDLLAS